jgi:prepilin-type N-terminal cleavage/methylation domain-containing protein
MHRQHAIIPSRARPFGRGFTLIELIVVIVLTAIVGVSAIASMSTTPATRQKLAVRTLARDLNWLRERAISTNTTSWVTFNTSADTYTFLTDNPTSPGFSGALALTDPATGQPFIGRWNTREFVAIDMISVTTTSLGFDWMGRHISTGGVQLSGVVTITASGSRTVTIQPQTGLVAWQ